MPNSIDLPSAESPLGSILSPDLAAELAEKAARSQPSATAPNESSSPAADRLTSASPAPPAPANLEQAGLSEGFVDSLLLKILLGRVTSTGEEIAQQSCLPRGLVRDSLARLRDDLLVTIKGQVGHGDYCYQLSEAGQTRATGYAKHASYAEAAPVPLEDYERAIRDQAIGQSKITVDSLREAFGTLTVADEMLSTLAQAVSDGRGMFLYGSPGNGKTTLAEQLCGAFSKLLWIPRTVSVGTDLIRVYDESCHEEVQLPELADQRYDRRWVLIKRPTVVVGGELTLEQLDPSFNPISGISEAPVQMKANGGVLVIDDFGRQRVGATELLNRMIVPLEKQHDYLALASGRQARVPFEMLCVLSTNLEPRELVDEAFLRRIPYKVEVTDPTLQQFVELFQVYAGHLEIQLAPGAIEGLLATHYAPHSRPLRFCHPRDLLRQAKNFCVVHDRPAVADRDSLNAAVKSYFAGL